MRAQISLDIMLAIAIGFIAISGIVALGNEITEMQKQAGVRQQLDSIGTGLAQFISGSNALSDADSATVSFEIPEILVLGETLPQQCDIKIDKGNEELNLSYETVTVTKAFVEPAGMDPLPDTIKCGQTITITK